MNRRGLRKIGQKLRERTDAQSRAASAGSTLIQCFPSAELRASRFTDILALDLLLLNLLLNLPLNLLPLCYRSTLDDEYGTSLVG